MSDDPSVLGPPAVAEPGEERLVAHTAAQGDFGLVVGGGADDWSGGVSDAAVWHWTPDE